MTLRLFHIARAIESAVQAELPDETTLGWLQMDVPVAAAPTRVVSEFWRLEVSRKRNGILGLFDRILRRRRDRIQHHIRLEWRGGKLTGRPLHHPAD